MDLAVVVGGVFGLVGLFVGQWLGRRQDRQNRLRTLYTDALHAAIRTTPRSLGYRVGPDDMAPSDDEMNLLRARLSVESKADEDEIMQGLVGVHIFSGLYQGEYERRKADPSAVPMDELGKTEQRVRDAMDLMETTIRKRLAATDRILPELQWPWRKTPKPAPKK